MLGRDMPALRRVVANVCLYQEQSWEYRYNHQGLRLSKRSSLGVDTLYRYDTGGHLLAEESQGIVQEYVWLGGNPIAMVRTEGDAGSHVYVVGSDHLGTPMRLWEQASGSVAWAADYEVFGRAWEYLPESPSPPAVSVSLRFPGQIYDEETGLHYNWWRFYDPSTGRYLQPDPLLADPAGLGVKPGAAMFSMTLPYSYAMNSPLAVTDPDGLIPRLCSGFCLQTEDYKGSVVDNRELKNVEEATVAVPDDTCGPNGARRYRCYGGSERATQAYHKYTVTCHCLCKDNSTFDYYEPFRGQGTKEMKPRFVACQDFGLRELCRSAIASRCWRSSWVASAVSRRHQPRS